MTNTDSTDTAQNPAHAEGATSQAVPPQVGTTPALAEAMQLAEDRRFSEHVEMAINLGIGFTLSQLGATSITVNPDSLQAFSNKYRVTQNAGFGEKGEAIYTIGIVERD